MVSKSDATLVAAVVLLAGGAYVAATAMNPATQKLALLGAGVGVGVVVAEHVL